MVGCFNNKYKIKLLYAFPFLLMADSDPFSTLCEQLLFSLMAEATKITCKYEFKPATA